MKTKQAVKSKVKSVKKVEKKIVKAAAQKAKAVKKAEKKIISSAKKAAKKVEKKIVSAGKKTVKKAAASAEKAVKEISKKAAPVKSVSVAKVSAKEQNSDKLTPQEIKDIEKHLLEMREEVQNRIKSKKEHEMPETEVGDEADIASQSLDKEVLFELNGNAQALLDQIESALRRISKGIYGTCEYCRCQIPKKRILALPFARYCIRCQSSNEGIKR